MKYKIEFEKKAFLELNKLDQLIARRVLKIIKEMEEGFESKDVKRLKGEDILRLRIGSYRVLFIVEKDLIKILKIGHRKNIYKR